MKVYEEMYRRTNANAATPESIRARAANGASDGGPAVLILRTFGRMEAGTAALAVAVAAGLPVAVMVTLAEGLAVAFAEGLAILLPRVVLRRGGRREQ